MSLSKKILILQISNFNHQLQCSQMYVWWSNVRWSRMRRHKWTTNQRWPTSPPLLMELHWLPAFSWSPLFWHTEHQLDLLLLISAVLLELLSLLLLHSSHERCLSRHNNPDSSHPLFPDGGTTSRPPVRAGVTLSTFRKLLKKQLFWELLLPSQHLSPPLLFRSTSASC